jgi:hypothetical protein
MARAFGFSFVTPRRAALFVVLTVVFVLGYHRVIQISVRDRPATTLQAVQEHCRYILGKRFGLKPNDEVSAELQRCKDIRVKSVESAGGVFDPVIVKITVEAQPSPPFDSDVFIFKTADISPKGFNFLSSFSSLITGRWAFNFYNTYSDRMFHGSF